MSPEALVSYGKLFLLLEMDPVWYKNSLIQVDIQEDI